MGEILPTISTPSELYNYRPKKLLIEADSLMRRFDARIRALWTNDDMQPICIKLPKGTTSDVTEEIIKCSTVKGWECKKANNGRYLIFDISKGSITKLSQEISAQRMPTISEDGK